VRPSSASGGPPPFSTAPRPEPLPLSALEGAGSFALLGPGFSRTGEWTLLTGLEPSPGAGDLALCAAEERSPRWFRGQRRLVTPEFDVAPQPLSPSLDERGFLEGVAAIREAVAAGDVYQVNLTLRAALAPVPGAALLATLCARAVPRFAAWVRVPGDELVSASPELLFETVGRLVHAEPMKGTAPAGARAWLEASLKDGAELAMITDLLRNDLAQLCTPGSVQVEDPRRFIELPYVVQAVSDVTGALRDGLGLDDVLRVLHPGGSVTGAPRSTALDLIARLEPARRGLYCGALLLHEPDEDAARCALLIRTAARTGGGASPGWTWGVGSGITWGSDPAAELDEVRLKMGALSGR
jgi:para-aminobenzoate synthetase component 1